MSGYFPRCLCSNGPSNLNSNDQLDPKLTLSVSSASSTYHNIDIAMLPLKICYIYSFILNQSSSYVNCVSLISTLD